MRIAKNNKVISFVMLAIMLVSVAITASLLVVFAKNKNDSLTIDSVQYTIDTAVRNNSNVSVAMLESSDDNAGETSYTNILYPNHIYLDVNDDSLEKAGYYFDVKSSFSSGLMHRIVYFKNTFGYWDGKYNDTNVADILKNDNSYTLMKLFNYNLEYQNVNNVWEDVKNVTISADRSSIKDVSAFAIGASEGNLFDWKYNMKGSLRNNMAVGEYTYRSALNDGSYVSTHYLTWGEYDRWGNLYDMQKIDNSEKVGFVNKTGTLNVGGVNYSYTNGMKIDITIYDKTNLKKAIDSFNEKLRNNSGILTNISGYNATEHAQKFIADITKNYLNKREVSSADIEKAIGLINDYKYQISAPMLNAGKVYDGEPFYISTAFTKYDSRYFDVKLLNSSGAEITTATMVDIGSYKIKIAIKNEVYGSKFAWADGSGNAFKEFAYTIHAKAFTARVNNQNYKYKVSAYDVGIDATYEGHIREDLNPINVALSRDKSTWTSTISKSDIGSETIFYKITSSNHTAIEGSFTLAIDKADIVLYTKEKTDIFGNIVPNQENILNEIFDWDKISIFDAESETQKRNYINEVLTSLAIAKDGIAVNAGEYVNVGKYDLLIENNSAYADKANISFAQNGDKTMDVGVYVVNPRSIKIDWIMQEHMWYDSTDKKPSAAINADENLFGQTVNVTVNAKVNGTDTVLTDVINAGGYVAQADIDNKNFVIEDRFATKDFEILQRKVNVTVKDIQTVYGSNTAKDFWTSYTTSFEENKNDAIYVLTLDDSVADGKGALVGNDVAHYVFKISLKGEKYTDDSENKYYLVGTYALEPSKLETGVAKNYIFGSTTNGELTISNAGIDFSLQALPSLVYKGVAQDSGLTKSDVRIAFKGWENAHRDNVQLYFADNADDIKTSTIDKFEVTNAGHYTIYYRIVAPNHDDLISSCTLDVAKSSISIDVTGQTSDFIYGNGVPTSDELITLLGIRYLWSAGSVEIPDMANRISFHLLDGAGGRYQTGDKIVVDSYTVVYVLAESEVNNFSVEYVQNNGVPKNVNSFKVSQKELHADWTQTGDGWKFDQDTNKWQFTYNGNVPKISVKAKDGEIAFDDKISLSTEISGRVVGSYTATTALTNPNNITNYKLVDNTFEFDIVRLNIEINVNNITRKFGQAQQNRPIGSDMPLLSPSSEGVIWNYADGSARFISDDYRNFCFKSDAIVGEGKLQNVGEYDISIAALDGTTGEITNNYNVIIVNNPKFTITPADISYSGLRFNVDFEEEDAIRFITKELIKGFISIDGFNGVSLDEFEIFMSDLKEDDVKSEDWVDQISLERKPSAKYYFSLKIVHSKDNFKNFNDFELEVEVNVFQGWINVAINGQISVTYGDELIPSAVLYDILKDKIEITGLHDMTQEDAFNYIKSVSTIYVGTSDGALQSNGPIGSYSIYFASNVADGRNIRFVNDSNINVYIINPKELEMDWDGMDINEVYGAHSEESASHDCVTKLKLVNGDKDVIATAKYEMFVDGEWVAVNGHAKNVGKYRVIITGVNSNNYFVTEGKLVKEFEITKASIEIKLNDRDSIIYGGPRSSRDGIIAYLNSIPDDAEQPFELINGNFCYDDMDNVADIFSYTLIDTIANGKNYFDAGTYKIGIEVKSNNYNITFENGNLVVENATIVYNRAQFVPRVYTGKNIKVEPVNGNIYYTLQGDVKDATVEYKIKGASNDFATDLFVTKAGEYEILIKISAPNHNVYITDETNAVKFEVRRLHVEIKMSQANKVYGDTLDTLLANANVNTFSEWLVKNCNIIFEFYSLDADNNRVPLTDIENLKNDFVFKVVQNAQGGEDPIVVGKNNVGTYTVTHEVDGDYAEKMKNYIVDYYKDSDTPYRCNYDAYNIVRRQIDVVWTGNEFVYNGNSQAPTASVKVGDLIGDDTCVVNVTEKQVNVGNYIAQATLSNNNYYIIDSNAKCNFVIKPKSVNVVWTGNEFVYNGDSQAPTASVKADDLIEDDVCAIDVKGGQTNAGSYTAQAILLNKNYIIATNETFNFVINPKIITFTWSDDVLVYNGSQQAPNTTVSGLVDGDIVEFVIDGAAIKAGTGYVARVTGIKNNPNYIVDNNAMENTKTFSIQKAKNEFVQIEELPDELDKLPWIDGGKPVAKYGNVVVKYFSDADCTQEVNDITKAGDGKYWIVVSVEGTDDYEAISRIFEIELTNSTNLVGIIAGSVAGGVSILAIVAVAIVLVIKKKKKA